MEILRLYRRLKSCMASTLIEVLVSMAIIGTLSLMLASGVILSLKYIQKANDIGENVYTAELAIADGSAPTVSAKGADSEDITVYKVPVGESGISFYYYS